MFQPSFNNSVKQWDWKYLFLNSKMNDIFVEKTLLSISRHYYFPLSVDSSNFGHLSVDDTKPSSPHSLLKINKYIFVDIIIS